MLDAIPQSAKTYSLLDLGCGPGLLLDFLNASGRSGQFNYTGTDLSQSMIDAARGRWPNETFVVKDLLSEPFKEKSFDYVIMNGVLTEKVGLPQNEMIELAEQIIKVAFSAARVALIFNVMSVHVDWQRDDLFHWAHDDIAHFLTKKISRHYRIRADYGLYEYMVFVYRNPQYAAGDTPLPEGDWWNIK